MQYLGYRLSSALPPRLRSAYRIWREKQRLSLVPTRKCEPGNLKPYSSLDIPAILRVSDRTKYTDLPLSGGAGSSPRGGVSAGDARALFVLTVHLRPSRVLEIGTHVGSSTRVIASALKLLSGVDPQERRLVTVDISDVNHPETGAWRQFGAPLAPRQLLELDGTSELVEFSTAPALSFLQTDPEPFDMIFLDGDHRAAAVYREVPAALRALNPGGIILLHDYFPSLQPLWPDGSVIPGPFLALERHQNENPDLTVRPFGSLPWENKQQSCATSLAAALRNA